VILDDQLFSPSTVVAIPKMPALGLMLEYPIFSSYNNKVLAINKGLDEMHADYRPPLDFDVHTSKMEAFKERYIYTAMREVESRVGLLSCLILGRTVTHFSQQLRCLGALRG
jgi:tRNA pseudouridine38-40 synthase